MTRSQMPAGGNGRRLPDAVRAAPQLPRKAKRTQAAAILFAQHYAEHLEQFDPASIDNLRTHFSDAQVAEILAYVRTITLGGLTGNALDALFDCLRRFGRVRIPT